MADQKHLDVLHQGVHNWNQWREKREEEASLKKEEYPDAKRRYPPYFDLSGANFQERDLRGVNLSGGDLRETRFSGADLEGANLSRSDLSRALFSQANLERANLSQVLLVNAHLGDANLRQANLREANLSEASLYHAFLVEADLSQTDLTETNFTWSVLTKANLRDAYLAHTIFGDVDLSEVQGLETLRHGRPPLIDLYTLARSSGRLPEVFLQQAGVDTTIIPSLLALFHPYQGAETWWWSEEPPSWAWKKEPRPQGTPQVFPGFPSWTHEDDYDEYLE